MKLKNILFYASIIVIIALYFYSVLGRDTMMPVLNTTLTIDDTAMVNETLAINCSAEFSSERWLNSTNNTSYPKYNATNRVDCECTFIANNGDVRRVKKSELFQYDSEPVSAELDCHNKCREICMD